MSAEIDADAEPRVAVTVQHGPARVSTGLAIAAGLVATLTSATSVVGLLLGAFGFVGLAVSLLVVGSRRLAGISTGIVFAAVVGNGAFGGPTGLVVIGALASILAFDLTQNAFGVGAQLSAATETWRGETVHAAASVAVGAVTVVLAFAVYTLLSGGQVAVVALVFLLLGAVLLLWAIRT